MVVEGNDLSLDWSWSYQWGWLGPLTRRLVTTSLLRDAMRCVRGEGGVRMLVVRPAPLGPAPPACRSRFDDGLQVDEAAADLMADGSCWISEPGGLRPTLWPSRSAI